ncbi:MAG TPA: hypothetical protein VGE24_14540 [Emticicia sp.]
MIELTKKEKDEVLENFMKEFFPFKEFLKVGFFTKKMKADYKAQAQRVCTFFGLSTVYEYGAKEIRGHITYVDGKRPADEPFITTIPSIYE